MKTELLLLCWDWKPLPNTDLTWRDRGRKCLERGGIREGKLDGRKREKEREGGRRGTQTCGRKCRGGGFTGPSGIAAMKRGEIRQCVPLEMLALPAYNI